MVIVYYYYACVINIIPGRSGVLERVTQSDTRANQRSVICAATCDVRMYCECVCVCVWSPPTNRNDVDGMPVFVYTR